MMATFESLTWQAVGIIVATISTLGAAVVWAYNKVYQLGKTDQRITNIEYVVDVEFREKFKAIDKRFDKLEEKMDKKFDKLYALLLKKQ